MRQAAGRQAAAILEYQAALDTLPQDRRPADEALFHLGDLLQRQGQWVEADLRFDRLLYLFGDSAYADEVRSRIRGRAWVVQAGAFAQRQNAEAMAKELAAAGVPTRVVPIREGLLAVRDASGQEEGRYSTYSQAAARLGDVRRLAKDAVVTTAR